MSLGGLSAHYHIDAQSRSQRPSLGPDDLTLGTLSPNSSSEIPTVMDGFLTDCEETSDVIGVFFEPTTSENALNGELAFGAADSTKIIPDSLVFTPISKCVVGFSLSIR